MDSWRVADVARARPLGRGHHTLHSATLPPRACRSRAAQYRPVIRAAIMNRTSLAVLAVAALAMCCWAVQLGGVAALNASCNNVPSDISTFLATNPAGANLTIRDYFQVRFIVVGM